MTTEFKYCSNEHNLDEMSKKHPEYTRIYLNLIKKKNKSILKLSKGSGEQLYVLSSKEYNNLKDYLIDNNKNVVTDENIIINEPENKPDQTKRIKQQNLFNFIKKK